MQEVAESLEHSESGFFISLRERRLGEMLHTNSMARARARLNAGSADCRNGVLNCWPLRQVSLRASNPIRKAKSPTGVPFEAKCLQTPRQCWIYVIFPAVCDRDLVRRDSADAATAKRLGARCRPRK